MAQSFFGARQQASAEEQATTARAKLAQLLAGIDPNSGATPEQQAQIYALDPDAGGRAMEGAAAMVRATRLREQTLADRAEGRTYAEGQTAATRAFETGQEATIDTREQGQQIEQEKRAAAARLAEATGTEGRAAVAAGVERAATPDTALGKLQADFKEGRIDQATYDAAVAKEIAPAGSGVTINTGDSGDLRKEFNKKMGSELFPSYMKEAATAGSLQRGMELLDMIGTAPQGPLVGRVAQMFPGFDTNAALFESIVKRLAPAQREPGSGATSDIEYAGMLASLPSLINNPEANKLISAAVRAQSQIAVDRGRIVQQWQAGKLEDTAAFAALADLNSKSIMTPQLQAMIDAAQTNQPIEVPTGGGEWTVEEAK